MSIVNRRNAIIGWATWSVLKQVVKRNAKAESKAVEEDGGRRFRLSRAEEVEQPKKKRKLWRLIALASATAVGVGIWMGARRKGGGEPLGGGAPLGVEPLE